MRYLRWVGLVFSLLIVGVLGGLIAPLSSEAVTIGPTAPTLSIKVETVGLGSSGPEAITLTTVGEPVRCTGAGTPEAAYNYCYRITTYDVDGKLYGPGGVNDANARKFKVMNAPDQTAKLLIFDGSLDLFTLTGVQFVPCVVAADDPNSGSPRCNATSWPSDPNKVTLTISMTNTFNITASGITNGSTSVYRFGLKIAGKMATSPNPIDDTVQMTGTGNFGLIGTKAISFAGTSPETTVTSLRGSSSNTDALMFFPIAGPDAELVKFPLTHASQFPGYKCNNGRTGSTLVNDPITGTALNPYTNTNRTAYAEPKCTPFITLTLKFELVGPDIVILDSSSHACGGNCGTKGDPVCAAGGKGGPKHNTTVDELIQQCFDTKSGEEAAVPGTNLYSAAIPCDDAYCNGTFRHLINVTPAPVPDGILNVFPFIGAGPDVFDFTITADVNGNGELLDEAGLPLFSNRRTGRGGSDRIINLDNNNLPFKDLNSHWAIDNVVCSSLNGFTIKDVDFTTHLPGINNEKGPVTVHAIGNTTDPPTAGNGDTLTCVWHVKNEQN
jgi:hypothetical protein